MNAPTSGGPEQNFILEPKGLHMEILDLSTRQVWQFPPPVARPLA